MTKRIVSFLLAITMLCALCLTPVMADTVRYEDHYPAPTSPTWSKSSMEMDWDWEGTKDDYFQGFEIHLYHDDVDVDSKPGVNGWNLVDCRILGEDAALSDFNVTESGWYCFTVCAYGEKYYQIEPADGSAPYWTSCEMTSPVSERSPAVYFETKEAVSAPENLRWVGTTMYWDVASVDNIDHFDVRPCYTVTNEDGSTYENWITTGYVDVKEGMTTYSIDLAELGVGEDWLLDNGSCSYYFKVMAISADITVASDTDWVTGTAKMVFNADAERLSAPTNLAWDGRTMTWDLVDGYAYDVTLYFLRELTQEELDEIGAAGGTVSEELTTAWSVEAYWNIASEDEFPFLSNDVMWDRAGDYYFTVKTRSNDPSQYLSSEWSEASDKLHVDGLFTLPAPTNLSYDAATEAISWEWKTEDAQQADCLDGYELQVFYRATEEDELESVLYTHVDEEFTSTTCWKDAADRDGLYSFQIMATTNNYGLYAHGDWSERSAEFQYDAPDPLPAPTGLAWNGSVATWSALVQGAEYVSRYYVDLYYCGADGSGMQFVCGCSLSADETSYAVSEDYFQRYGAGVYCFKVRAESNNTAVYSNGEWATSEYFTYTPTDNKLATPTNVRWEGQTMVWDIPEDTSGIAYYDVNFYVPGASRTYGYELEIGEFHTLTTWEMERMGDTVYFQVRAISDNVNAYGNSEWAVCESTYEKPEGLPVPTDLMWDGSTMTWAWSGDTSLLRYFNVTLYYAENLTDEPKWMGSVSTMNCSAGIDEWGTYVEESGYYFFTVRARSTNTELIANSSESELSASYYYTMPERLAAPTNVKWDGSVATWTASADASTGLVKCYEIELICEDGYAVWGTHCWDSSCRYILSSEVAEELGAGVYTFTVRALTNNATVKSKSVAVGSDTFTYTPTTAVLDAPTNLRWEGKTMKWDAQTDGSVAGYEVRYYNPENPSYYYTSTVSAGGFISLGSWVINRLGENIHFKVRALTSNISVAGDSDWAVCESTFEPVSALPTPTDLTWAEDGSLSWSWSGDSSLLRRFYVMLYYAETAEDEPVQLQAISTTANSISYNTWAKYTRGPGLYYLTVRAYSLNTDNAEHSAYSEMSAPYNVTMKAVGAPTNVHMEGTTVVWTASEATDYRIYYYLMEDNGEYVYVTWDMACAENGQGSQVVPGEILENFGNGTWRAGVVALSSDYSTAVNSCEVMTDSFTYTNPGKSLDTPTNLRWEGMTIKWDIPEDASAIHHYTVFVYAPDDMNAGWIWEVKPGDAYPEIDVYVLEELGTTLTFSVQAMSRDANAYSDSEVAYCATNYVYEGATQLSAPTNVSYDQTTKMLTWDEVEHADLYFVEIYYAETADAELELVNSQYAMGASLYYPVQDCGYFEFVVTAESWSELYEPSEKVSCKFELILDLPKLSAPTDLYWERDYVYNWNEDGTFTTDYVVVPGIVSYTRGETHQGQHRIRVYKVGETSPVYEFTSYSSWVTYTDSISEYDLLMINLGSGTYYYTVQALGDLINYVNSDVVTSDTWEYVNPNQKLSAPTNLHWDESTMCWSTDAEPDDIYGAQVFLYYAKTLQGEPNVVCGMISTGYMDEMKVHVNQLNQNGAGYYWFEVRLYSADIEKATTSEYSVLSPAYYYPGPAVDTSAKLEEIVGELPESASEADVAAAVKAVKDLDNRHLANAMAQEQGDDNSTLALLETLEEQLADLGGAESEVAVDPSVAETFDTSSISVIGAALNAGEDTDTVVLSVGAASSNVPDLNEALYTSAVQFSMHLEDEAGEKISTDGGELAVPVHITLPVPTNINPAFLVVLHYDSDGDYERIYPNVYLEDDQWFASFVVTSFSDFALAALTVDAIVYNGNVQVDVEFAVALDGFAICAVYNAEGKQLGAEVLGDLSAGEHTLYVDSGDNLDEAAYVKLFILDENGVPTYVESPCNLT